MRGDLKNITQYRMPSGDAFASVVHSFGEANSRRQALAIESVGRAFEIQSQFVGKAYDTYISEVSKLGRTFFVFARPLAANFKEKKLPTRQVGDPPRRYIAAPEHVYRTEGRNRREESVWVQKIEKKGRFCPPQKRLNPPRPLLLGAPGFRAVYAIANRPACRALSWRIQASSPRCWRLNLGKRVQRALQRPRLRHPGKDTGLDLRR